MFGCLFAANSIARKWRKIPVSSRSEIDMNPVGLSSVTRLSLISCGHSLNQTNGSTPFVPLNQVPPTPQPEASTKPMKQGLCSISSLTWVGRAAALPRSSFQSAKRSLSAFVILKVVAFSLAMEAMRLSRGPSSAFPIGIAMEANCSLPWISCSFFSGIGVVVRCSLVMAFVIFSSFSFGS